VYKRRVVAYVTGNVRKMHSCRLFAIYWLT